MKNRAWMLFALVGLFGCGLCNLAVAQNAVGGPKKPAIVGGPVKPVAIGGPAKPAVVAAPVKKVAPVVAANKPAPVVVPAAAQPKCSGHCDAKGIHH
jgi:hypothetical protein